MKGGNIQKLVSNGHYQEALTSYASSLKPTDFTFPFLLKACGKLQSIPHAQQIHTHILKSGFQSDIYTTTALVDAYMNLQQFHHALKMFYEIPNPTIPTFNAIISRFSQYGHLQESIQAFKHLKAEDLRPNLVTIASILPACETVDQGSQLHGLAVKAAHDTDKYVGTALVTMYSNCNELDSAREVFGLIDGKSVVSYNAMISGFLQNRSPVMGLDLFREMMARSGERPSSSSLLSLLSVCSELSALLLGKEMHCYILKCDVSSDVMIGTALVDMYSKCGLLDWSYRVFMEMGYKNLITWNSMISGVLTHGQLNRGVELFHRLRQEGFKPDTTTWNLMISGFSKQGNEMEAFKFFIKMQLEGVAHPSLKSLTSLLQACSSISDVQHGKEIHSHAIRTGVIHGDDFIKTALVHMYMQCGCSLQARRIFDHIERNSADPALWNAMISGYGRNGEAELALEIFRKMQEHRVKPNSSTFLSALSACSHSGQIEKGWELFTTMEREFGVKVTKEHFGGMVDLLGRAGRLDEAWNLIQRIPEPSASAYYSLLGACDCHSDAELGKVTAARLSELEPWSPTPMVVLSNMYARQGKCNIVELLRKMMIDKGLNKVPGCSWFGGKQLLVQ